MRQPRTPADGAAPRGRVVALAGSSPMKFAPLLWVTGLPGPR